MPSINPNAKGDKKSLQEEEERKRKREREREKMVIHMEQVEMNPDAVRS